MSTEGLAGFYIETRNYGATAAGYPRAAEISQQLSARRRRNRSGELQDHVVGAPECGFGVDDCLGVIGG
ncbi:MAG: hypothetical protein AAEJ52_18130 [Myxococcota bacterium]